MTPNESKAQIALAELVSWAQGRDMCELFDWSKIRPEYEKALEQSAKFKKWIES